MKAKHEKRPADKIEHLEMRVKRVTKHTTRGKKVFYILPVGMTGAIFKEAKRAFCW